MAAVLIIFVSPLSAFATNQNIVYQGRIVRPDGTVPNSGTVSFSLAIYSPGPEKCLLYSENHTVNMTGSQGMFSLKLGDGTRTDGGSHLFKSAFVNGSTVTGLNCSSGTQYTSGATDSRTLVATFNDAGTVVTLENMSISSVPFALQALEVSGWGINNLVKVSTVGSPTTFTTTEMANAKTITGLNCSANEILKWNGTAWACASDATGSSPGDAGYGSINKGTVAFDTDAATSGISVTAGLAKLSNTGVAAATYGSAISVPVIAVDAQGRITTATSTSIALPVSQLTQSGATLGQVLKWNGTAWAPAADNGVTADASYSAKGIIQIDTDESTSGISVASGVAKVNTGTGANQIVKLDGTGKLPALDGSALSNVTATSYSGVLPIANGGTNSSTALNNNRLMISSGGAIVEAPAMTNGQIVVGSTGAAPQVATLGSSNGISITTGAGSLSIATNATDANTASTIVSRDASGNFAAGAITNTSNILKGATAGTLTMTVPTSVTSYTLTWPSGVGSAGQFLTTDASGNLSWGSPSGVPDGSYATKGILQGLTDAATSGLNISSGVISVNSGTAANQIVKLNGSAQLPAVDGSLLTNLDAGNIASGVLSIARGGTNNGSLTVTAGGILYTDGTKLMNTGAGTSGQALISAGAGAPVFGTLSITGGGTGATSYAANSLIMANGTGSALTSMTCSLNQILKWDGTAWSCASDATGTSPGDAGYGSGNKGIVAFDTDAATSGISIASGIASVNSGTGANQIVKLNGSAQLPAVDGSLLTNLSAGNIASGTLPIARGGTNSATALNNNRLMISSGGAIVEAPAMTNGQIVVGSTGATPQVATLGSSNGISITTGAGSLSIATNATDANTASTIVSRDASGNFAASAITNTSNILKGATAGTLTMTVPASLTSYSLTWPSSIGSAGQVLTTDASGNLSWGPAAGTNAFLQDGNSFGADATLGTNDSQSLHFETNSTTRMTILSTGNIGIGTTAPGALLEINGSDTTIRQSGATGGVQQIVSGTVRSGINLTDAEAGIFNGPSSSSSSANSFSILDPGNSYGDYLFQVPDNATRVINFRNRGAGWNAARIEVKKISGSNDNGTMLLKTTGHSSPQLFLDSVGNVGIGTTSPGAPLDVKGELRMTGSTSGYTGFKPQAAAGSTVWTLPNADGSNGQFLRTDGSGNLSWGAPSATPDGSYSTKGILQGLTDAATSGLNISSGVISVNSGTAANQIVKLNSSAQLPAVDGSLLTNLSADNIATGVLPIARGGTNNGSLAITAGGMVYTDGTKLMNTGAGTSGQALISAGAGAPAFGTVGVAGGGTGLTSGTSGGIPYYDSASTMAPSAALTANGVVLGGGAGAAPTATSAGSANQVLRVPAGGGAPAFGTVEIAGGGTGATSFAANQLIGTNVTGTALVNVTCSQNQLLSFDASGNYGCYNANALLSGNYFVNGGNSFTAAASLGTNDAYSLSLKTNNTSRMTIDSSGNVGIGTTSAGALLHLAGGGNTTTGKLMVLGDGSNLVSFIDMMVSRGFVGYNGNTNSTVVQGGSGKGIHFNVNNATFGSGTAMVLDSSGNVGIGTTSPSSAFHVATGNVTINNNTSVGGNVAIGTTSSPSYGFQVRRDSIYFTNAAGSTPYFYATGTGVNVFASNTPVNKFSVGGNAAIGQNFATATAPTNGLLVESNVGIGTTSPTSLLDLNGAFTVRGMAAPANSNAGHGRIYFDSTANKFKVSENNGNFVDLVGGSGTVSGTTGAIPKFTSASAIGDSIISESSGKISVNSAATEAILNVRSTSATVPSILVENPNSSDARFIRFNDQTTPATNVRFDVGLESMSNGNYFFIRNKGGTDLLTIDHGGSVGIGKSGAGAPLDVKGEIRMSGSTSGYTGFKPQAAAGSTVWTLPNADGTNGQFLRTDGSGNLSWASASAANAFVQNGNSLGANAVLGTNDNYPLSFETNNTTNMTILSSGNVGIGTTNPQSKLQVTGGPLRMDNNAMVEFGGGSSGSWVGLYGSAGGFVSLQTNGQKRITANYSGSLDFQNESGTTLMTALANGNVGIGTTSPGSIFHTYAATAATNTLEVGTTSSYISLTLAKAGTAYATMQSLGSSNDVAIYNRRSTGNLTLGAGNSYTHIVINSSGNVGIGTTSATEKLHVVGNVMADGFITSSDRRLKSQIETVEGLDLIRKLRGVQYTRNASGALEYGVIAQEVEAVAPHLVKTDPATGLKAVHYQQMISPLIEAVKSTDLQCRSRTQNLERNVASLQEQNQKMQQEMNSMKSEIQELKNLIQELAKQKSAQPPKD